MEQDGEARGSIGFIQTPKIDPLSFEREDLVFETQGFVAQSQTH